MVDGAGRTVMETFGNGALTERDVSPRSGAVESIFTHHGTNLLQGLVVRHNVRLNVDSREDKRQQKIERFQHDELDRLTCSRVEDCESPLSCLEWSGPCDTVIEYDAAGDITFKSDVGTYTYDPAHPHAVQLAGSAAFANDAVGNQITRPDSRSREPRFQGSLMQAPAFLAAFLAHLPTSSPDAAEPEPSFQKLPAVQYSGDVVSGAMIGTVPGGSIGAQIAIDAGALPRGTREARLGKAVGEIGRASSRWCSARAGRSWVVG